MTLPVRLRRAAHAEYDAAGDWYEQQRTGLGASFTDAVQAVFDQIAALPQMHAIVLRDIRKAVVQGFPYCVYYRVRPKAIVVLSVFHTSAIRRFGRAGHESVNRAKQEPRWLKTINAVMSCRRRVMLFCLVSILLCSASKVPITGGTLVAATRV